MRVRETKEEKMFTVFPPSLLFVAYERMKFPSPFCTNTYNAWSNGFKVGKEKTLLVVRLLLGSKYSKILYHNVKTTNFPYKLQGMNVTEQS